MAESLPGVVSLPVLPTLGRRGAVGVGIPDVLQFTASSSSSSSVVQVFTLFRSVEEHYFYQVCD